MNISTHSISTTTSIFSLIVIGYALSKLTKRNYSNTLSDYVFYLALPLEILLATSRVQTEEMYTISGFLYSYILGILAFWCILVPFYTNIYQKKRQELGLILIAVGQTNTAYLAIPIFILMFGSPTLIIPIIVFQSLILTTICITMMQPQATSTPYKFKNILRSAAKTAIKNPLIPSAFLGLALAILKIPVPDSGSLGRTIELIATTAAPIALLALGASFNEEKKSSDTKSDYSEVTVGIAFKVFLHPIIAFFIGKYFFSLDGKLLLALVVVSAMPSPKNTFILAKAFNLAPIKYNLILLGSTLFSFIAINLAFSLI